MTRHQKTLPVLLCDYYKLSHRFQFPKGTSYVYSNWIPRKSLIEGIRKVVGFGPQIFVQEYLVDYFNEEFFEKDIKEIVRLYKRMIKHTLFVDDVDTQHIEDLHALGYLPIEIKAVAEGTLIPLGTPLLTIENTNPKFFWLTNFLETMMSAELWQPATASTIALEYKKILTKYALETVGNTDHVQFQAHDFSFRGMQGVPGGTKSAMAHLTAFVGTDTVPAIDALERYYFANIEKELVGTSIPATEHSVMCAHGQDELASFREFITETYPSGYVSIVSDTWDFWNVIGTVLPALKEDIMKRDGKVVIRPDSGVPEDIICGKEYTSAEDLYLDEYETEEEALNEYFSELWIHSKKSDHDHGDKSFEVEYRNLEGVLKRAEFEVLHVQQFEVACIGDSNLTITELEDTLENKGLVQALYELIGGTVNDLGYIELDSHIGAIYGDGITLKRAEEICRRLKAKGYASSNIVLGIGSFSYQYLTRDSLGFAMKATYIEVNGEGRMIFKAPKTDTSKTSLRGRVVVYEENGEIKYRDGLTRETEKAFELTVKPLLETIFLNGEVKKTHTLSEIRQRIQATI
jgi:nicotinamide phosphoribosyltransferase